MLSRSMNLQVIMLQQVLCKGVWVVQQPGPESVGADGTCSPESALTTCS